MDSVCDTAIRSGPCARWVRSVSVEVVATVTTEEDVRGSSKKGNCKMTYWVDYGDNMTFVCLQRNHTQ
jgi:hypothetical protein